MSYLTKKIARLFCKEAKAEAEQRDDLTDEEKDILGICFRRIGQMTEVDCGKINDAANMLKGGGPCQSE